MRLRWLWIHAVLCSCLVTACTAQPSQPVQKSNQESGILTVADRASTSWSADYTNPVGETSIRYEFRRSYWSTGLPRALWFDADEDRGVLVFIVEQDGRQRLVGLDDETGELVWERLLTYGWIRCSQAGLDTIACTSNGYYTSAPGVELALIEGATGNTVNAWEFDLDHPLDAFTVTDKGLYVLTHDLWYSLPAIMELQHYELDEFLPDSSVKFQWPDVTAEVNVPTLDISENLRLATIEMHGDSGARAVEVTLPEAMGAEIVAPGRPAPYRHTTYLAAGWELRSSSERSWELLARDGSIIRLGVGEPWLGGRPGRDLHATGGWFGFNNLKIDLADPPSSTQIASKPLTDFYLYRSPAANEVIVVGVNGARAWRYDDGDTSWRLPEVDPFSVAAGSSFVVALDKAINVVNAEGRVIAHLPMPDDPAAEYESWELALTPHGFVLVSDFGAVRAYEVS